MSEQLTEAALPPLTDSMTAADLGSHAAALQTALGGKAEVYVSVGRRTDAAMIAIYPLGIIGHGDDQHIYKPTWPEVFAEARRWIASHGTVSRDKRIRKMALAIIEVTDEHGRCTERDLSRRDFSWDEIRDFSAAACERASEMAGNAPFSVLAS